MVSSINRFAGEMGSNHVVKGHAERARSQTISRSATNEIEYEELMERHRNKRPAGKQPEISAPFDLKPRTIAFDVEKNAEELPHHTARRSGSLNLKHNVKKFGRRKPIILMLREERDRFDTMRAIQRSTHNFKRYSALTMSVIACESLEV